MGDYPAERHSSLLIIFWGNSSGLFGKVNSMRITTFAAIYIGSYEVSLKIFELSAKKAIREIDHVRARVGLGKDSFKNGYIGYELIEDMVEVLLEYKKIMEGYKVDDYEAFAGTTFRETKNELFVLDQLRIRTGIQIQVLSNSEHRFIGYKSIAFSRDFDEMTKQGAAVVDIGGGSIQITMFSQGRVVGTQQMLLGTMRLLEQLSNIENYVTHYEKQIEELVDKELKMFQSLYIKGAEVKYIIFMGDYIVELMKKIEKRQEQLTVSGEKFIKAMRKFHKKNVEQIASELNLSNETDKLLIPYIVLYRRMAEELRGEEIWAPGVSISDGIAYDYAQRHAIVKPAHDFEEDIISAAQSLSERYMSFSSHTGVMVDIINTIFDGTKKIHGMGEREHLLLKVAAILHDCGKYISLANNSQCAYQIIMQSEIIGLSHLEREIVACTVLYHASPLDEYEFLADRMNQESYMVVAKLAAILQVANAMDCSHKQKIKEVKVAVRGKQLIITVETMEDIILEKGLFHVKAESFERVFGVQPVIREKRVYS